MLKFSENLYRFRDTCNVYVVLSGDEAVLVDFGDSCVLESFAFKNCRPRGDLLTVVQKHMCQ